MIVILPPEAHPPEAEIARVTLEADEPDDEVALNITEHKGTKMLLEIEDWTVTTGIKRAADIKPRKIKLMKNAGLLVISSLKLGRLKIQKRRNSRVLLDRAYWRLQRGVRWS